MSQRPYRVSSKDSAAIQDQVQEMPPADVIQSSIEPLGTTCRPSHEERWQLAILHGLLGTEHRHEGRLPIAMQ